MVRYLMLDKNDITNVCGVISRKDVLKEITNNELVVILNLQGKLFRDKYYLVEEDFDKEADRTVKEVKIGESKCNLYYVSRNGTAYSVSKKTGKKTVLNQFYYEDAAYVKIIDRQYSLKMLVAKAFIPDTERYDIILHKNGDITNCNVDNLIVIKHSVYAKKTGALSRSRPVGLFKNGKLVREWTSARKCAKDMYCSLHCIASTCNGKVKNPLFDVRWLDEK